jgi:phage tail sheath protein FI
MSNELLASKIIVVEKDPAVRGIASAPTSVAGAVGVTQRGPTRKAVLCTSFDEFQARFGGYVEDADLPLAVKGFFENGGTQIWISRVVGYGAETASLELTGESTGSSTAASVTGTVAPPFVFQDGDVIEIGVRTLSGSDESFELEFTGEPASLQIPAPGGYGLTNGMDLYLEVDWGPAATLVFSDESFPDLAFATRETVTDFIVAAVPELMRTDEGEGGPSLTTRSKGRGSAIRILGGSAAAPLGFDPFNATVVTGEGNVNNLSAVTAADLRSVIAEAVNADTDPAEGVKVIDLGTAIRFECMVPGALSRIAILGGEAAIAMGFTDHTTFFGVDGGGIVPFARIEAIGPGAFGNTLFVDVLPPGNANEGDFSLRIRTADVNLELFENLSRSETHPHYFEAVLNHPSSGSKYVRAVDYADVSPGAPFNLPQASSALEGGDDGDELEDSNFIGGQWDLDGLYAFDAVPDVSIVLVPGRATPAVHSAMLGYCEVGRGGTAFAVLDPPPETSAAEIVEYVKTTASLENASEYGAIYWPRVLINNPDKNVLGASDRIAVAPSGIIAGVFARNDASSAGGIYTQPAGIEAGRLFGVLGFESRDTLKDRVRDLVYPHRINPLTTEPGLPKYIDGSRTLKVGGSFPFIAERRGVSFIERSLKQGLQFARFRNNTPELRAQVRRSIVGFLLAQMKNGAFRTQDPATAFFVDVSDELNTPSVIAAGKLVARIGVATNKPAEFIILEISQDTRALEEELAQAG